MLMRDIARSMECSHAHAEHIGVAANLVE